MYILESASAVRVPLSLLPAYLTFTYTVALAPLACETQIYAKQQRPSNMTQHDSKSANIQNPCIQCISQYFTFPMISTFTTAITCLRSSKTTRTKRRTSKERQWILKTAPVRSGIPSEPLHGQHTPATPTGTRNGSSTGLQRPKHASKALHSGGTSSMAWITQVTIGGGGGEGLL